VRPPNPRQREYTTGVLAPHFPYHQTVASATLRLIQRSIGSLEQGCAIGAMVGEGRHAERERERADC